LSTTAVEQFEEHREIAEADPDLVLHEAATVVSGSLREAIIGRARARGIEQPGEGAKLLQVIRPGVGGGRGRRYYSPDVLREAAHVFTGARMFKNHLTEKQRKELEGLPRPVEHLGGRIVESWWDGEVPASDRFERGGVYAWSKPIRSIGEMIDDDPDLIESSISALATSIRPGKVGGTNVTIVEGIRAKPVSVDWIAGEGGAGGRVLMEAAADEEEEAVLESLSDDRFTEYLERERPGLLEALREPGGDHDDDRRREQQVPDEISPELLTEALASPEGQQAIRLAVTEAMQDVTPSLDEDRVMQIVEARMADRADLIRLEATREANYAIEVRDMERRAHSLVEAAKLHPKLATKIKERFSLDETGEAADGLNVVADFDEDGQVTKSAMDKLVEAVTSEIDDARDLQTSLGTRTMVRGQGGGSEALREAREARDKDEDKGKPDGEKRTPKPTSGSSLTDDLLREAGYSDEQLPAIWVNGR
jgi:hypothetical protein